MKKNKIPVNQIIIIIEEADQKLIEKYIREVLSENNIHFMTPIDIGKGACQRAVEIHTFGKNEYISNDPIRYDIEFCIEYENN